VTSIRHCLSGPLPIIFNSATTWLVGDSVSTLSVNIQCSRTKYRETNKQYKELNSVINGISILKIELDKDELKGLSCIAVRPHTK